MVETWHIDTASRSQAVAASAIALLLDAPFDAEPAGRMLAFLNEVVPVDYLSLVEYVPDGRSGLATPELVEGHACANVPNITPVCFAHYRRHFWREDRATHIAQHLGKGAAAAPMTGLHFKAGDIHVPSWRTEIYDRARLADRFTFLYSPVPQSAYSINLYRDLAHGAFQSAEIERLLAVAPLLKQAHRGALRSGGAPGEALALRVQRAEDGLRRSVPELSPRERAVCARIAYGISADGIAAELDVAPSTVITLRKRAYAKLNARGLPAGRMQLAEAARRLA